MKSLSVATGLVAAALGLGLVAPAFAGTGAADQPQGCALNEEVARRPVNIEVKSATAEEVSTQLSAVAGVPIVYAPAKADDRLSMQASNMPLGEVIADLSKRGAVAIGGQSVTTKPGTSQTAGSQKVSLDVKGLDAAALSRMLGTLLQTEVVFKPTTADFQVNLAVKEMPVDEFLQTVRRFGDLTLQTSHP